MTSRLYTGVTGFWRVRCTARELRRCSRRTFTNRHSLKNLCGELLGVEIEKEEQSSDWGRRDLTAAQMQYAATDVVHLHRIRESLDAMLEREGRIDLAESCFKFLPWRARIDVEGWADMDIFAHGATP